MPHRRGNKEFVSRRIIRFGVDSGYCYEHVTEIKRVYFESNVNALNLSFRRCPKDLTVLIVMVLGEGSETCDMLKISDYFTPEGGKNRRAPKFFFYNGIPINLHCKAPMQDNRKEFSHVSNA